jgi:hypothetical protein
MRSFPAKEKTLQGWAIENVSANRKVEPTSEKNTMSNETNNQQQDAPNAADFLGGNYLKREDMRAPIVVTITDVWSEVFRNSPRKKLVVSFQELPKPLILNKTNIRRLANVFQTGNTALWRGPVTLYLEKEVQYAGQIVGGIRIRPAELQTQPQPSAALHPAAPEPQPMPEPVQAPGQQQPENAYMNGPAAQTRPPFAG